MKKSLAAYICELCMRGILAGIVLGVMLGFVYGDGILTLITGLCICLGATLIFALVRSKTSKFGLFFISHLLLSVLIIMLIPKIPAKVMCGVVLAVIIGDSIVQMKKPFDDGNVLHFGMAVIFLLANYGAESRGLPFLQYSCYIMTALFMVLYFMRVGFYNTQQFIKNNDNGKSAPLKSIRLRSYILVAAFALCVGVFMIATRYMGGDFIVKNIGNAILAFFSAIARWIIYKLRGAHVTSEITEQNDMFGFVKEAVKEKDVPAFVKIIEKIIRYFFIAAIIIGAVALVIWAIFKLYSIFGKKGNEKVSTVTEFIPLVKNDKTKVIKSSKEERNPVDNKARRYYKKYIKKYLARKELSQTKTPLEISHQLGIDKLDNDSEIRRIYEKARYSNERCTKEEIKAIKEYIKGNIK